MQVRRFACVVLLMMGAAACSANKGTKVARAEHEPTPVPVFTPVPTVPPGTPMPSDNPALPTRPVGKPEEVAAAKKSGKAIGPIVSFLGVTRADGKEVTDNGVQNGVPLYITRVGSGFQLVVEAKPGAGNYEPGRRLSSDNPKDRPDLEVEFSRPLGDGSTAICDKRRPKIGGIPAVNPTNWSDSEKINSALLDASCRFETFIDSSSSCTVNKRGDFAFIKPDSMTQYCMIVAKSWEFPEGETTVTVRVRDVEGNPGPPSQIRIRRQPPGTPQAKIKPTHTPTPVRRRP